MSVRVLLARVYAMHMLLPVVLLLMLLPCHWTQDLRISSWVLRWRSHILIPELLRIPVLRYAHSVWLDTTIMIDYTGFEVLPQWR
jgi:hypothetical protein